MGKTRGENKPHLNRHGGRPEDRTPPRLRWMSPNYKPTYRATVPYSAVTVASAMAMWYVPYFRGTTEERKRSYARMYAGTRQVLPARGDNPCPNLLHVCFHALFLINFFLALVLRFQT